MAIRGAADDDRAAIHLAYPQALLIDQPQPAALHQQAERVVLAELRVRTIVVAIQADDFRIEQVDQAAQHPGGIVARLVEQVAQDGRQEPIASGVFQAPTEFVEHDPGIIVFAKARLPPFEVRVADDQQALVPLLTHAGRLPRVL